MQDFFAQMSTLEQIYWIIALVGSTIFSAIFILTLFGSDADLDADMDADFDADTDVGFSFFTFKSVVAFFTIFGWTGVACLDYGMSLLPTLAISTVAGLIMMFLTSLLFYGIYKMAESGTLNMKNAIGAVGEVYLPIGANRTKVGKVQIKVQGSLRELEAITDSKAELTTNTIVRVISIISAELLLVEKINN